MLFFAVARSAAALHEHPADAHGELRVRLVRLSDTDWGHLALPITQPPDAPLPVVVVLSERGSRDGRSALYAMRLLSLGYAVLDADFADFIADERSLYHPERAPRALHLRLAVGALRDEPRFIGSPSVIGIGEGARAVLMASSRAGNSYLAGCGNSASRIGCDLIR